MKVKKLSTVMVDGMVQFLKIEDNDDTAILVNVNKISTITQKLNGDIEISVSQEERILLKDTTIVDIEEALEDSEAETDEPEW